VRGRLYIDHNVLGQASDENFKGFLSHIKNLNFDLVTSHLHLTEINKGPYPERYISRLSSVRPAIMKQTDAKDSFKTRELIFDYDPEYLIRSDGDFHPASFAILQGMIPLLKMVGGLAELNIDEILEMQITNLRGGIEDLKRNLSSSELTTFDLINAPRLRDAEAEISSAIKSIDFDDAATESAKIRAILAKDGGLANYRTDTLVDRVKSLLAGTSADKLFSAFPKEFANMSKDPSGDIGAFAFAFYTLGAIPRFKENIKGQTDEKIKRFTSQFIDALHIGEASFTDAFVTMDKRASRLASAVYSHAGVRTKSILVEEIKSI
jgi:hypothetical protein